MTRPLCPACNGTRVMGVKHPRPCSCCTDGTMPGIDDPTPDEWTIYELRRRLAEVTRRAHWVAKAARQRHRIIESFYAGDADCAVCGCLTANGICTGCRQGTSPFVLLERQCDAACGWAFELGRAGVSP